MARFKDFLKEALREIEVHFSDGSKLTTNMASGLSDKEMTDYYKIGRAFNIGAGGKDKMVKVKKTKIIK